jgi:mono/diheme cytochrome c family protein
VLRADCVASHYFSRNPNYKTATGINVQTVKDQSAWPIRPTPGVNRGYRSGQLREDHTLATVTAACGPGVYRGDQFPEEFRNNVFVCEPSGNLIKRNVMSEVAGMIAGKNPYEKADFLGSTDERFRPVNLYTGPDGTLYVVDLYRGILQHRIFVTTFLRKQILERGLDKPIGLGRIYRVVHEGKPVSGVHPKMSKDTPADLVKHLSNPNAWWRELAQRTLIERADRAALPLLKELATSGADPLGRVHALWTLEGLGKLDLGTVSAALNDKDVRVKVAAMRVSEVLLRVPPPQNAVVLSKLLEYVDDKQPEVRLQLAFTLGECADPRAMAALATIMKESGSNPLIFDAVFTSIPGREVDFAAALAKETGKEAERALVIAAGCVFADRRADRVTKLLDLIAAQKDAARQAAMLDGMIPKGTGKGKAPTVKAIEIAPVPAGLEALAKSSDKRVKENAADVAKLIVPPGTLKPIVKNLPPLTAAQQAVYDHGKAQFALVCAQCHQPDGMGEEGKAPPFVDSEWVDFPDSRLGRIVINGLKGPVNVNGREYTMEMPGVPQMDDKTVAGVLTYIRREFGNGVPVDPEAVKKIRIELGEREDQWSEADLMKLK